eukprot:262800_1
MCWDLSQTLSNPFRKSASDSLKLHLFVWFVAVTIIAIVSPFHVYRRSYDICSICKTGSRFNVYDFVLFYLPLLASSISGVTVTIVSFKRLSRGLSKTFALRLQTIRRQLILVGLLSALQLIGLVTLGIMLLFTILAGTNWDPCNSAHTVFSCLIITDECSHSIHYNDHEGTRIFMCVYICADTFSDALTWYLLQKLTNALFQLQNEGGIETNKQLKPNNLSDGLRKEIVTIIIKGIILSLQNLNTTNKTKPNLLDPLSIPADNNDYILLPDIDEEKHHSIQLLQIESRSRNEYSVRTDTKSVLVMSYAETTFSYLRRNVFDISDASYQQSILPVDNVSDIILQLMAKFDEGLGENAFYFWSHDGKYLLKTISKQQTLLLLNILDKYSKYMTNNKESYLPKYFGLFSFQFHGLLIYIVVLKNIFPANYIYPDQKYEIKGSWIDRHTNVNVTDSQLLKDSDLHIQLILNERQSAAIYEQLSLDTKFLEMNGVMDYALLLGIWNSKIFMHNRYKSVIHLDKNDSDELKMDDENDNRDNTMNLHIYDVYDAPYIEGPGRYCIGIIDTLQQWDST